MNFNFLGVNFNVELLILICVIYLILVVNTLGSCCKLSNKESFTPANTNYGESKLYSISDPTPPINPASWNTPNMVITPGQPISKGAQQILDRPKQPIPLPEGQMMLFADTEFKPQCCPNTYSTGAGCACMTVDQLNYLNARGGNNIPYSQY